MPRKYASWSIAFLAIALTAPFAAPASAQCTDADSDAYYYEAGCGTEQDCNDAAAGINPGATELCNGFDDDCDGLIDNDAACDRSCDSPGVLGADIRLTETPEYSTGTSAAWTGSEYAVVWSEGYAYEVTLARLDPAGSLIGGAVIPTGLETDYYSYSKMVWTGSEYGVVYGRYVQPPSGGNWISKVYFHRFDAAGNPLGSEVQVNEETWISAKIPRIAWDGSHYGIVWDDYRDGHPWYSEAYFARFDASGNKVGSDVRLTMANDYSTPSRIVWTGEEYGLVWVDSRHSNEVGGYYREIYFARLDASGNRIGDELRVTDSPGTSSGARLAWSGSEYGVAWTDNRDDNNEVYFTRIDNSGNEIGDDIRITYTPDSTGVTSLIWNGEEYGLALSEGWSDTREIFFCRLDAAGNKISDDVRMTFYEGASTSASLVANGDGYGMFWNDGRHGEDNPREIYFNRIGCAAIDGDSDAVPSTIDCDDANSAIGPTAVQTCFDGLNNDCNHPNWPSLVGTNEVDDDGDGPSECAGDCNDADPDSWNRPSEVRDVMWDAWNEIRWTAPIDTGGTVAITYDVIYSDGPFYSTSYVYGYCGANDVTETWATDNWRPFDFLWPIWYYVVQSENNCPEGKGSIGTDTWGNERLVAPLVCP